MKLYVLNNDRVICEWCYEQMSPIEVAQDPGLQVFAVLQPWNAAIETCDCCGGMFDDA